MNFVLFTAILGTVCPLALSQRPFYAQTPPPNLTELAIRFDPDYVPTQSSLGNRFGEDGQPITTTTMRLPVDALGDRELVERISKWPRDKWPFWYANWRAIEEQRNKPISGSPTTGNRFSGGSEQNFPSGGNQRPTFARDPNIDRQQAIEREQERERQGQQGQQGQRGQQGQQGQRGQQGQQGQGQQQEQRPSQQQGQRSSQQGQQRSPEWQPQASTNNRFSDDSQPASSPNNNGRLEIDRYYNSGRYIFSP